jgi:HAD superfamily phosphoserine phosphatase-like hydrolase
MITVIIPALNEEATVAQVVSIAFSTPGVNEVIVVDDKSMDNTIMEARKAGAKVITSTKLGKGTSMMDGIHVAKNEVVAFLDADIVSYCQDVVGLLTSPILTGEADFVKSFFDRQAGRVTELVAKPLLSILYPEFPRFKQPLSGMIAGKRKLFMQLRFEEGYGVDIGILIDMYHLGASIREVNIGMIENRMQPLEQLGRMSREVAWTIIMRSRASGARNLETYENIQVIREQMEYAIREGLMSLKKIAMFDMDNTILRASFIQTASERFGFRKDLMEIVTNNNNPFIRTKQIARLLRGRSIGELLETADGIDVTPNLEDLLKHLREQGYITGIISDSYDCITNHIKNRFGFDFTISNELEFSRSIATGEVKIPSFFLMDDDSLCKHDYCKLNALIWVCKNYGVDLKNTLVIGDGENDICCIRRAGIGISFCSSNSMVDSVADYSIKEPDFSILTPILNRGHAFRLGQLKSRY